MPPTQPVRRGEIWHVDLGSPVGSEAGDKRYALVISSDQQNASGVMSVLPITRTQLGYASHIEIDRASSGMSSTCYVQTEQIRTVDAKRLDPSPSGKVDIVPLMQVEKALRYLLRL